MNNNEPILYMPIGPSGCGKSTLFKQLKSAVDPLVCLSNDIMRCILYEGDYKTCWAMSTADKQFKNKVRQAYDEMLEQKVNIYIDNTNLSPKVRRYWLIEAKKKGYRTIAVLFDVDVDTLLTRQQSRDDKTVPHSAIHEQRTALKPPIDGEFDYVFNAEQFTTVVDLYIIENS